MSNLSETEPLSANDQPLAEPRLGPGQRVVLGFTVLQSRAVVFTAVVLGIAFADTIATTAPGRLAMFALGAMTGGVLGLRVAMELPETGRIFRWTMAGNAALIVALDVAAVIRWT